MKLQYKIALALTILLLAGSQGKLYAQTSNSVQLTLEECREMALENNYNLKSSSESVERAKDVLAQYKTNFLPNISLTGNAFYSTADYQYTLEGGYLPTFVPDATTGELVPNIAGVAADGSYIFNQYAYMPDIELNVDVDFFFTAGVQLTQAIYMGGKVSNAVKLAKKGVSIAELSKSLSNSEVIIEADQGYYTYLQVEEKKLAAEKYFEVVEEFYRTVGDAVDEGMATRNDLMKVEVRLNEAKLMLKQAENGLRLARMNLCYITGLPLTTQHITLVDRLNSNSIESELMSMSSEDLDVSQRVEYRMLEEQIAAKEIEVKLSRSEYLPQISMLASYSYVNGATLNSEPLMNSAGFTGGVMIQVPLFHWGEGRRKVSSSKREVNIAKNQFEDLTQKMRLELMQAVNNYQESVYEVELTKAALSQAEENMRMSRDGYESGMENLSDYLESQALWQKSMSELVDARAGERLNYTNYLKCAGLIAE